MHDCVGGGLCVDMRVFFREREREDGEEAGKMLLLVLPEKRSVYSKRAGDYQCY